MSNLQFIQVTKLDVSVAPRKIVERKAMINVQKIVSIAEYDHPDAEQVKSVIIAGEAGGKDGPTYLVAESFQQLSKLISLVGRFSSGV